MWESRNLFNKRFSLGLNQEDAYVNGYFGIRFDFNQATMEAINASYKVNAGPTQEAPKAVWTPDNASKMLSSLCEGVTALPGGTMNTAIMTGMGGPKWGAPSNVDFGDEMTIRFRELSGMPIRTFITSWTNVVRNTNTGASQLRTEGMTSPSGGYTKKNFSAGLLYWTMKPNARDVEMAFYLTGLWSTSDLRSQIATDLTTVDGQAFDVNFHVDALYCDLNVIQEAQNAVEKYHKEGVGSYYEWDGKFKS